MPWWDPEEIAGALRVSKSSVSLWVRDLRRPERLSYRRIEGWSAAVMSGG
jgi:hypothetical protein